MLGWAVAGVTVVLAIVVVAVIAVIDNLYHQRRDIEHLYERTVKQEREIGELRKRLPPEGE